MSRILGGDTMDLLQARLEPISNQETTADD
jgi:hypothetical protein